MREQRGNSEQPMISPNDAQDKSAVMPRGERPTDMDLLSDDPVGAKSKGGMAEQASGTPASRPESEGTLRKSLSADGDGTETQDTAKEKEKGANLGHGDETGAWEGPEWLRTLIVEHPRGSELAAIVAAERNFRKLFPTRESAEFAREQAEHLVELDQLFYSQNPKDAAEFVARLQREDGQSFDRINHAWADQFLEELWRRAHNGNDQELAKAIEIISDRVGHSSKSSALSSTDNPAVRGNLRRREEELERREQDFRREEFIRFFRACDLACESAIRERIEELVGAGHFSSKQKQAVVREIYEGLREALSADTLFMGRMATAVRTGNRDAAHQEQAAKLFVGRARQALPEIARRILSEWTQQVMSDEETREARRRTAAARPEVSGGGESPKGRTLPRVNYRKMTDMDILNL